MTWNMWPRRPEDCECRGQYEGEHLRCQQCGSPHRWGEERVSFTTRRVVPTRARRVAAADEQKGYRDDKLWGVSTLGPDNTAMLGYGPTRAAALADLKRKVAEREAAHARRKPECPGCGYRNDINQAEGVCAICVGAGRGKTGDINARGLFGINGPDGPLHRLSGAKESQRSRPIEPEHCAEVARPAKPMGKGRGEGVVGADSSTFTATRPVAEGWGPTSVRSWRCTEGRGCGAKAPWRKGGGSRGACDTHVPRKDPEPQRVVGVDVGVDGFTTEVHGEVRDGVLHVTDVRRKDPEPTEHALGEEQGCDCVGPLHTCDWTRATPEESTEWGCTRCDGGAGAAWLKRGPTRHVTGSLCAKHYTELLRKPTQAFVVSTPYQEGDLLERLKAKPAAPPPEEWQRGDRVRLRTGEAAEVMVRPWSYLVATKEERQWRLRVRLPDGEGRTVHVGHATWLSRPEAEAFPARITQHHGVTFSASTKEPSDG